MRWGSYFIKILSLSCCAVAEHPSKVPVWCNSNTLMWVRNTREIFFSFFSFFEEARGEVISLLFAALRGRKNSSKKILATPSFGKHRCKSKVWDTKSNLWLCTLKKAQMLLSTVFHLAWSTCVLFRFCFLTLLWWPVHLHEGSAWISEAGALVADVNPGTNEVTLKPVWKNLVNQFLSFWCFNVGPVAFTAKHWQTFGWEHHEYTLAQC